MKKLRTFLFSSVPLLLGFGIQFVAVYYIMFIAAIFMFGIAPAVTGNTYGMDEFIELGMNTDFNAMVMVVFSVSCSIVFGIWYKKRCGGNLRIDVKKQVHPLEILGIVLLVPGTQYLSGIVASIVSVIFPSWLEAYEELLETAGLGDDIGILMFIYSVLLAPISEELLFRGVTLGVARRAFPFWIANIIQAFFFGVFHMNMLQGCYTFVLGLILGYIYEKSGSLYHVIFFHFLFNLWGTSISQLLVFDNVMLESLLIVLSLVFGLGFGSLCFYLGRNKKIEKVKLEKAAQI